MSKRAADGAGSPAKKAATTAEPFVIGLADVEAAAKNIEGFANMTPVMTSGCMDGIAGEERERGGGKKLECNIGTHLIFTHTVQRHLLRTTFTA